MTGRWRCRLAEIRHPIGDDDVLVLTRAEFRKLRPSRHPVVLGVWSAFAVVSVLQLIHGVSPASVNSKLEFVVQAVLAVFVIVGVALNLCAAWARSDKFSLGAEIGGLVLLCTTFTVYALAIMGTVELWAATVGAAWSFGMLAGTLGRTAQIFRRGW